MLTKWWLKLPVFQSIKIVPFLFAAHAVFAFDPGVPISDESVRDILTMPLSQRLSQLKQNTGVRERLVAFAYDPHESLDVRWRSLTALADLSAKSYRWEIEGALKSHEWFMRNAGLVAVMHDDQDRAISWSERMLTDPALVVRTQAVKNLIDLHAEQTREVLWTNLYAKSNFHNSQSLWVRSYMAKALALWGRPVDQKRFLRMLMDQDVAVEKWAIYGLERSTGMKLSDPREPIGVQKQKWLSRLSTEQI